MFVIPSRKGPLSFGGLPLEKFSWFSTCDSPEGCSRTVNGKSETWDFLFFARFKNTTRRHINKVTTAPPKKLPTATPGTKLFEPFELLVSPVSEKDRDGSFIL